MITKGNGTYFSRRKVLFTYLVTYLIIITILFLVIGSLSYSNIVRAEHDKVQMEMEQAVNEAVGVMDAHLRDVLKLQSSFNVNLDVSLLRKMEADFKPKDYMHFLEISDKLSNYTSTSQFLDRVVLYFHFNHLFISSDMLDSRPKVFFKLKFPNDRLPYKQWRTEQLMSESNVFCVREDSIDGYVNLYYRLPILDKGKGVTVITGIKVKELIEDLGVTDLYNDSALVIVDRKGNLIYTNRESAIELMNSVQSKPDRRNVTLEGNSYEWYSEKLSLLDWTVSYFVSTDEIYADSRRTSHRILGMYFLVLISSLILAVVFSKEMSVPVTSLLRLVDGGDNNAGLEDNNASLKDNNADRKHKSFITKSLYHVLRRVSDMFDDNIQLTSKIHEYRENSRGNFYNRLLKGEVISADEIKMIEDESILHFAYYTVAISRIISHNCESFDMAMFALSEMFSNTREKGFYFCKTAFDRFSIIICGNEFYDQREIANLIESCMSEMDLDSLVSLRWGIGDTVANYDQIFVSYRNAEYALNNMDVLDNKVIVWYDSKDKQKNRLTYSFDDAQRLYTLLSNGEAEYTIQAIRELVDRNYEVLQTSKGQRIRFISMLSETTLLLVSKITITDNQLEREIERVLRQMKRAESTDSIIECMSVTAEKICSYVNLRTDSNHQRLIDRITKFLDDNYHDPNLSLSSIAQSMRLTESYISSFFKQKKGINIQTYIEKKRMIKAVEMLKETNLATAEIVKMVGYYNTNTFYKAFKRNFNITPKECRESIK